MRKALIAACLGGLAAGGFAPPSPGAEAAALEREPAPASTVQAEDDSEPPGCAAERALDLCLVDSGNGYDMLRCLDPALRAAQQALTEVQVRIAPRLQEDPALAAAVAAAQASWEQWTQRDCDAVSQEWSGGSMRRAVVAACFYRHTLERAQTLWHRHEQADEGRIPEDCLPYR